MADRFTVFVRDSKRCKGRSSAIRLILYALASRADSKGYCYPSVEKLQEDTGLSRATIFRAMPEIREILTVDGPGYKHSNSYIFPYQDSLTPVDKVRQAVDKESHSETTVSPCDSNSLTMRLQPSHHETSNSLTMRPEEYIEDKQEVSLSLTLSQGREQSHGETVINNYDGTTKPKTKSDIERIKTWCKMAYLDEAHTTDFIRINRLAHWSQVSPTTTVPDLIADFVFKWKNDSPDEYHYYLKKVKKSVSPGAR